MASLRAKLLNWYLRRSLKPYFSSDVEPLHVRRTIHSRARYLKVRGVAQEAASGPIAGEWLRPSILQPGRTIYYLHGGGYIFGSPETHRNLTARLARAAAAPVFSLAYRLAPENPCPAAIDDALAGYDKLLGDGIPADQIFIGGDSAGGGLALALTQAIIARGSPRPGGIFLYSPFTDLTVSGASVDENSDRDPMFSAAAIRRGRQYYPSVVGPDDPRASPLFGRFEGFPPLLILVSDNEVLLDDSRRLAERARAAGVDATLKVEDNLVHAWPIFAPLIPETARTIAETAAFIRRDRS